MFLKPDNKPISRYTERQKSILNFECEKRLSLSAWGNGVFHILPSYVETVNFLYQIPALRCGKGANMV